MTEPLISIITPVYCVEQYIKEYFDSVLNQTYKNLEIICINDGSPDKCGSILNDYAEKDSRVIVINQENFGVSVAVNKGLDMISGNYVSFVDPDDWIEPNFYEVMISCAKRTGADIITSNYYREYPDRSEKMKNLEEIPAIFDDKEVAFRFGFEADKYRGFKMFLTNKLFCSRFFLKQNGLGLRKWDNLRYGGADVLLTSDCFLNANVFAYIPDALYHYRIRDNSISRDRIFSHRLGLNLALEQITKKLEEYAYNQEIVNLVKRFHTYFCSQLAEFAYETGDKENLSLSQELIRIYMDEYINSNSQFPDRIKRIDYIMNLALN